MNYDFLEGKSPLTDCYRILREINYFNDHVEDKKTQKAKEYRDRIFKKINIYERLYGNNSRKENKSLFRGNANYNPKAKEVQHLKDKGLEYAKLPKLKDLNLEERKERERAAKKELDELLKSI